MNGKEAYDKIFDKLTYDQQQELGDQVLRTVYQDLKRLEKLEKEHNKLKERYKHRAETSNDLCKAVKEYEKAIEILKDSLELTLYHNKTLKIYSVELMCFEEHLGMEITQEEYELLKEVLEND